MSFDFDLRPVLAPPPQGDGYRTMPGTTSRNGLPETGGYQWQGHVATPAEIVARLHEVIAARGAPRGGCEGDRHYFVKQGGQWVCTMCGETR